MVKQPVCVTVGLAFAAAKWENCLIFEDILEQMAIECPSTLSSWEEGPHEKEKGIIHSVGWECELLTVARNFDLDMFLPSLYLRIIETLTTVCAKNQNPARTDIWSGGVTGPEVH